MRVAISVMGALATCLGYGFILESIRNHFHVDLLRVSHAELFYIMLLPLLICIAWGVGPNLFFKFDRYSFIAPTVSIMLSYLSYVFLFGLSYDCAFLGGCM